MTSRRLQAVRVHAPAKINLTLRVLAIRPDGYHELRTTFQSLALHDTLICTPGGRTFTIVSNDPDCPADESNLVWKAAERLWRAAGRRGALPSTTVQIVKRVPVQAGLGGGSSDAASALRALRTLWRLPVADDALEAIGRGLGADVAFFLEGGTALGVERGDLLFPLMDAAPAWVVLVRPDFGVSTRDAYGWWDEAWRARQHADPGAAAATRRRLVPTGRAGEWVNDLQAPVVERHPRIQRLVRTLERQGARFAAMSGSGSAVFGLFDDKADAEGAIARMAGPTTTAWLTRTTTRRQHRALSMPRTRQI